MNAVHETSSNPSQSLDLDFPPQSKRMWTVAAVLVALPVGGLMTVLAVRLATGLYLLDRQREIPFDLIGIAALVSAGVALFVRWLQGMRDPGPARVTWNAEEFVEWRGNKRRVEIPRSEARQYLGELQVSYQTAGGHEMTKRVEGRVCQISDGKGKLFTVCDGERPLEPWLEPWRCHASSIDALITDTSRLPKAGEKLELDDRARARHDSRLFVVLSILGYVGTVIGLGILAAPSTSTHQGDVRSGFLAILVSCGLLALRSIRPLTELLSRRAEPAARRGAALELVLRLVMIAVVGYVAFAATDRVVKSGPYAAPYPRSR